MDHSTTPAIPATLWLTDRTRSRTGLGRCRRKRYLTNHFGPTGYGITSRSESLPLATGKSFHQGLEAFANILRATDELPSAEQVREIVKDVTARYIARVEQRGYLGILSSDQTKEIILEQSVLISGLLWALRLKFLPWLHQRYRILSVEEERIHLLEPTQPAYGPGLMLRTDILAQQRQGTGLAYFEGKTTGWDSDAWAEQWETDPQLGLGTLDVEQHYSAEVTELYVLALSKGARRRDANEPEGRKKQQSPLCYGYCRPGNPPFAQDDWLPAYQWVNEAGELKRCSRAHRRRGVWELSDSDWVTWEAYRKQDPQMPPEEFWVRMLPASLLDRVCSLVGPMNRQDAQIDSVRRSMLADEYDWQNILWELHDLSSQGYTFGSPEFQRRLDELIPCSWNCRPYGKEHQCEMVRICHRYDGWQDPLASGAYVARRPHHAPELEQAIGRGLLPEQSEEPEEEERA